MIMILLPRKAYRRGWLNTVGLLVLTSLDQLLFYDENIIYLCYKTSYINEEVKCTEHSPSVRILCRDLWPKAVNPKTFLIGIFLCFNTASSSPDELGIRETSRVIST
jgi:hypothetical protein